MSADLICPVITAKSTLAGNAYCCAEYCAWWNKGAKACAVLAITDIIRLEEAPPPAAEEGPE